MQDLFQTAGNVLRGESVCYIMMVWKRYSFWIFDLWAFLGVSICEIERYTVYIYIPKYPHFPGSLSIWKQGSIVTCISGRNLVPNLKGTGRWGFAVCPPYLKDPVLRICGSFRGETKPFRTRLTLLRGRKLTMVINHLLNGMILKVNTIIIPIHPWNITKTVEWIHHLNHLMVMFNSASQKVLV